MTFFHQEHRKMKIYRNTQWVAAWALSLLMLTGVAISPLAQAASSQEIDADVNKAMANFNHEVPGAAGLLKSAKGVLVFAGVIKAGLGIGGEYGEGSLRTHGKTVGYYSIGAASIGFQLGVQKKDVILIFMEDKALKNFRDSEGWKVGVDGSVAIVKVGEGGSIDSETLKKPILAFIVGQKGLMYNLTLEGSKITKLKR
jgi:lipid-binding SYLF domain-containing protein